MKQHSTMRVTNSFDDSIKMLVEGYECERREEGRLPQFQRADSREGNGKRLWEEEEKNRGRINEGRNREESRPSSNQRSASQQGHKSGSKKMRSLKNGMKRSLTCLVPLHLLTIIRAVPTAVACAPTSALVTAPPAVSPSAPPTVQVSDCVAHHDPHELYARFDT